tara:strand:- start:682 stop:1017 length:336 start_codon:yes stop_codon:yes gene_type:complete
MLQPPVSGRGVLLESCAEPGRFVALQKGDYGDVLLKLLPACANANCTAEASRFSFDEAVGNIGVWSFREGKRQRGRKGRGGVKRKKGRRVGRRVAGMLPGVGVPVSRRRAG